MSFQNIMPSPEPKIPTRGVQTATPSIARRQPTDFAPPEPSPKSSAAAHALLLCQQPQMSNISESLNENKRPAPEAAATVAFPTPQQQMTPSYSLPPGWHSQYALFSQQQGESPFPIKRLKVLHADLSKANTSSGTNTNTETTTTPSHQASSVSVPRMPPPPQYFATPYSMYAMNGIPPMPYGGQVPIYVPSPMAAANTTNTSSTEELSKQTMEMTSTATKSTTKTTTPTNTLASSVTPTPTKKNYSRKTKSLGILCENFIQTFSQRHNSIIVIDSAATELGVERRRIYDIINILESLDIVQRKCKNTYEWLGVEHLTSVFGTFQQVAFCEFAQEAVANGLLHGTVQPRVPPHSGQKKSLGKLSQQFLQLFLVGHEVLSLTDAADKILGTPYVVPNNVASLNSTAAANLQAAATKGLKTKIRRLYDISNVFCSLGICKKMEGGKNEKPKFVWDYKLDAKQIRELHLQTRQPNLSVYDPVAAAVLTTPLLATTSTPSQHVVAATLQEQAAVPTPAVKKQVEAAAATTPVSDDKDILANINAMGGASSVQEDGTELLCRTVSLV